MDSKVVTMKYKTLALAAACFFSTMTFATEKFPAQCRVSGLRYDHANLVLFAQHTAKPRLYAIQNNSKNAVWVVHESSRGMGAGWNSQLSPHHWTALLMTHPNFDFTCHLVKKTGGMKTVPCKQVLQVCQFSHFYSKNPISGGYWVGENLTLNALMTRIRARGFEV